MFGELSGMPQPSPTPSAGRGVPSGLSGQRHAGWVVACPAPSLQGAGHLGSPRSPIASAPVWSGRPAGAERLQCPLELTTQVPCAGRACAAVLPEGQTAPQRSGGERTLGAQDRAGGLWGDWPGGVRLDSGFESGSGSLFWSPD